MREFHANLIARLAVIAVFIALVAAAAFKAREVTREIHGPELDAAGK